jgi:8-oxo-dGTP pyrophosphatase MutT (NUDIX family)
MVERAKIIVFNMSKATGILLIRGDGALLLQLRDNKKNIKHPNMWGSPGGHLNKNETYAQCANRELFEETGYIAKNLKYLMTVHETIGNKKSKIKLFWEKYDNKQKLSCYEGQKLKFIKKKEAHMYKVVKIIIFVWEKILNKI